MTDFDENGVGIPGSYAISAVSLGMWGEGGKPIPSATSAICDVCGGWASEIWVAGASVKAGDSLTDVRISRSTCVIVYACPDHKDQVCDALVDEFGWASNRYEPDELATKVDESQRAHFRPATS